MRRVAVALAVPAVLLLAACGSSTSTSTSSSSATAVRSASPSSTTTTAAPRPGSVENGALRAQSCRDALPLMNALRKMDPAAPSRSAEDTIKNLPSTPEWPTLSAADRAATIAGIRDAANGQCGTQ